MKTKNIPPDIICKSINDAKSEILDILERLEKNEANLEGSKKDYERLLLLNNHVDNLFKEKLNSQYSGEKKYNYHNKYFNNLKEIFMSQYPEVSTSSYILSITSIMESWSYEAQEKGQRYSDLKVEIEYKDLCNSIIEIN